MRASSLEANPDYRHGAPKVKRVVIRHVPEPSAQRLQLEKGDIDIARNLTADQIQGLSGNADIKVEPFPKADLYYLGLNQKNEALAKPQVRQAIRWLVDYQGMADSFLKGRFQVHQSFWPSGFYRLAGRHAVQARRREGQAAPGRGGLSRWLRGRSSIPPTAAPTPRSRNRSRRPSEGRHQGRDRPGEQKQVITKYRARNHDIVLLYWSPDYMDPHSNADSFARNPDNSDEAKSKPLAWRNAWDIPEITKETDAAARERDPEKRKQMYLDLQKKLQEDGPFVIMFQSTEQNARRANVNGFVSGPTYDTVYYRLVTKS